MGKYHKWQKATGRVEETNGWDAEERGRFEYIKNNGRGENADRRVEEAKERIAELAGGNNGFLGRNGGIVGESAWIEGEKERHKKRCAGVKELGRASEAGPCWEEYVDARIDRS